MIVDYSAADGLALLEPDDFKGFKLRLRGDTGPRPEIPGVAFVDDDNVLIRIEAVTNLPGAPATADWLIGFGKMVDYAAARGWVDETSRAIRAHIERVP